jgi:hypothetical protein
MSDVIVKPEPRRCCPSSLPYRERGSIYQCDECGQYWYASAWETFEACGSWGPATSWRPVRWWKFLLREQIRAAAVVVTGAQENQK